jgi:hypothetical protein
MDLLGGLNLFYEKWFQAKFGIAFLDRILVGVIYVNDFVALNQDKFALVGNQLREFVLVNFQFFLEWHKFAAVPRY